MQDYSRQRRPVSLDQEKLFCEISSHEVGALEVSAYCTILNSCPCLLFQLIGLITQYARLPVMFNRVFGIVVVDSGLLLDATIYPPTRPPSLGRTEGARDCSPQNDPRDGNASSLWPACGTRSVALCRAYRPVTCGWVNGAFALRVLTERPLSKPYKRTNPISFSLSTRVFSRGS